MSDIYSFSPLWGVWNIKNLIGEGCHGKVYRAEWAETGSDISATVRHIAIPDDNALTGTDDSNSANYYDSRLQSYYRDIIRKTLEDVNFPGKLKNNEGFVTVHEQKYFEKASGIGYELFLRMELLPNIGTLLRNGLLDAKEILKLGTDVLEALEILESHGRFHGNIKNSNIFKDSNGRYKLGDYGLPNLPRNTVNHTFMAPEAIQNNGNIRSDIYSLGLVLYRLFNNNRAPFVDDAQLTAETAVVALERRLRGETLPYPANADVELAGIICRACAFRPEDRFYSATDFRNALIFYGNAVFYGVPFDSSETFAADTEAEQRAGEAEELTAKMEAEQRAGETEELTARMEAEQRAVEAEELMARMEIEQRAREAEELMARMAAEQRTREAEELAARMEAEQRAREAEELTARMEAEQRVREAEELAARMEAEQRAREAEELTVRMEAEQRAREAEALAAEMAEEQRIKETERWEIEEAEFKEKETVALRSIEEVRRARTEDSFPDARDRTYVSAVGAVSEGSVGIGRTEHNNNSGEASGRTQRWNQEETEWRSRVAAGNRYLDREYDENLDSFKSTDTRIKNGSNKRSKPAVVVASIFVLAIAITSTAYVTGMFGSEKPEDLAIIGDNNTPLSNSSSVNESDNTSGQNDDAKVIEPDDVEASAALPDAATVTPLENDADGQGLTVDRVKPVAIAIGNKSVDIIPGEMVQLTAIISLSDGSYISEPVWFSSDSNVAVVSQTGVVTAKGTGIATITASYEDFATSCQVNVGSLQTQDYSPARATEGQQNTVMGQASEGTDPPAQTKVETPSAETQPTETQPAEIQSAKSQPAEIQLAEEPSQKSVIGIDIDNKQIELTIGQSKRISSMVEYSGNGETPALVWSSSNSAVASVNVMGVVTARSQGTAMVTAYSGGKSVSCIVNVN